MRVSTNQIFDNGAYGIQKSQSALFKLNNQISTGRRVLTPQDDPVAAARVLVVTQSQEVNQQHIDNQGQAKQQLALVESQLGSVVDLLNNVREKVIQAGNPTLIASDREAIAAEVEERLGELVGIANSDNGVGEYIFSGFRGNVKPFAIDASVAAKAPATTSPFRYDGDSGERLLQVSSARQMSVSAAGDEVFMIPRQGNGTFVSQPGINNQGSALTDIGSVLDPGKWEQAINDNTVGKPLEIRFQNDANGRLQYGIFDPVNNLSVLRNYVSGQKIPLVSANGVDFGAQVTVTGQPKPGDTFTIKASERQSVFQTLQNVLGVLRNPQGGQTQYTGQLSAELANIDQAMANVSRIQSDIGARQQEIESLTETMSDLNVQYKSQISDLQDLDYAKAISDFIKQQTNLEAAQKSFAQISSLSLFKYL